MTKPDPHSGGTETGETAPHVRPKFSRRPVSFSRTSPHQTDVPLLEPTSEPLQLARPSSLPAMREPHLSWQEDARFGVVMLVLVVLVNIALMVGLPLLPASEPNILPMQVNAKAPSMPVAVGKPSSEVTIYSQPDEERRTIYMLDLQNTSSQQLSVSPYDTPAPTARALDDADE
jgi:hypothetical protein